MPSLTLQRVLVWLSGPILQLLCLYLLSRHKLLRQFPFFTSYLIFLTLLNGIRLFCYLQFGLSSWTYYSVYWIGNALTNMIVIAVLYELFCVAFRPFTGLQDLAKIAFKWAAGVLFVIGVVVFLSRTRSAAGAPHHWLTSSILNFEQIVSVMELALLLLLFVGSQQAGLAMKTRVFGFALGFGFQAFSTFLIYLALLSSYKSKIPFWSELVPAVHSVSLLIWIGYLLKPGSSAQAAHIPVASPLVRWNEAAQRLGNSSSDDKDLLRSIAANVSLLLAKRTSPEAEYFQECAKCGACYNHDVSLCPSDGSLPIAISMPRLLGQRYRLERHIGAGGMGTVYEATDIELHRHIAAKLIREELVGSPGAAHRFSAEARAAATFCHPNVVTIHDFGVTSANRAFLIMELLAGRSLRKEMIETGKIPGARTLWVLRGVCAALEAAHKQQLVHRDLKPENIFIAQVGATEIPKLLDFGLAKFLPSPDQFSAETASGELAGTPRYMCPEQLRGLPLDPAWDLWALTVVAYEMLCGAYPFATQSTANLRDDILQGRFVPIRKFIPDPPRGVPAFFESTFAANPAHRPCSVNGWLDSFERALSAPVLISGASQR